MPSTKRWRYVAGGLGVLVAAIAVSASTVVTQRRDDAAVAATNPPAATTPPALGATTPATLEDTPVAVVDPPATAAPTTPVPTTAVPTSTPPLEPSPDSLGPVAAPVANDLAPPAPPAPVTPVAPRYQVPVEDVNAASYAREHHDYPAADIFVRCGATIVAPVDGTVLEVRRTNEWDPNVDNPATRGGRSMTIIGIDGVRYYFAHFEEIAAEVQPGATVGVGSTLGRMGASGRASACHLHFGISPPCPGKEWSVRRGVIEPWDYLDAWRRGEQFSPLEDTDGWQRGHPDQCASAMADPNAAQS